MIAMCSFNDVFLILFQVLKISLIGHRKRVLASLGDRLHEDPPQKPPRSITLRVSPHENLFVFLDKSRQGFHNIHMKTVAALSGVQLTSFWRNNMTS